MATGVLIVGVGKGTKSLPQFLECTKTYETVVLFGAATDSYDAVGKVVGKKEYKHVTRELVEEKLKGFRGEIMQKPSVFSALKVNGKTMYEMARAGETLPEVPARKVTVESLEMVEWLEPGTHDFKWPGEEVEGEEKEGAAHVLGIRAEDANKGRGRKRSRSKSVEKENAESQAKKVRIEKDAEAQSETPVEPVMSGALPVEQPKEDVPVESTEVAQAAPEAPKEDTAGSTDDAQPTTEGAATEATTTSSDPAPQAPAARLRMTVTSGFYVRSLCHDLGLACNSFGLMSSLIRSRQGDYELGKNVLEWSELQDGPEVWEPKVRKYLEDYMAKEGWEPEEVEDEEVWKSKKKEREQTMRESGEAGGKKGGWRGGKGNWRGKRRQN